MIRIFLCTALLFGSFFTFAQTTKPDASVRAADEPVGEPEAVKPLSLNDVRAILDTTIDLMKQKINDAKKLTEEERIRISRDLEREAEEAREALDMIIDESIILGETTYAMGLIVTYQGEAALPTFWPNAKFMPGGEGGVAIVLRNNQYFTESIRFVPTGIASIGGELTRRDPIQKSGIQRGLKFKLLLTSDGERRPVVALKDFEGSYTGVGFEANIWGHRAIGPVFIKNTFERAIYMVSLSRASVGDAPVSGLLKEIILNFPENER